VRYIVPSAHRDRVGKPLCSYNDVVQFGIKTAQQHGVMDVFCTHLLVDLGLGDKAGSRAEQRSCRQTLVQRKCARACACARKRRQWSKNSSTCRGGTRQVTKLLVTFLLPPRATDRWRTKT
jgi:hypothetical protein